LKVKKAYNNN